MIRLRPSGADEVLIKRVRDWYEPGPGVFIAPQALFNPALLFTTGVNGTWHDPSDLTTLFQDAAGTTPVTAMEQPVGLMLDKSGKSPATWLQKIDDPTLSTTAGWSNPSVFSNGKYISGNSSYSLTATIGKLYRYTYTVSTASAGGLALYVCGVQKGTSSQIPAGTYSGTVVATSTKVFEFYDPGWGWTGQIDSVSVEELQGNHAFNSSGNSANFPVLSARYNLLTKTEQFDDNMAWVGTNASISADATSSPIGTNTADKLIESGAPGFHYLGGANNTPYPVSWVSGISYTFKIYCKKAERSYAQLFLPNAPFPDNGRSAVFDLNSGTVGTVQSGVTAEITGPFNGFYLCSITATADATTSTGFPGVTLTTDGTINQSYTGDGTSGIYIWGADLRVSNDALSQPAYQRVNTATDYDTAGFKPYLRFNGTNQWLQTNSIDFTYGDKMFVSAGVRKLSDGSTYIVAELSQQFNINPGAFAIAYPVGSSLPQPAFGSNGTTSQLTYPASGYAAPITNVLSGIGNISGDQSILRVNGSQVAINTGDQGTGNYGNYPLYIGARAGTSLWFNGRLYGIVVAGKQASAAEITSTETYLNQKTGAF